MKSILQDNAPTVFHPTYGRHIPIAHLSNLDLDQLYNAAVRSYNAQKASLRMAGEQCTDLQQERMRRMLDKRAVENKPSR